MQIYITKLKYVCERPTFNNKIDYNGKQFFNFKSF